MRPWILLLFLLHAGRTTAPVGRLPERLVVLTFGEVIRSHAGFVALLLKRHGFGGPFFKGEFPPDFNGKSKCVTWAQIFALDSDGF